MHGNFTTGDGTIGPEANQGGAHNLRVVGNLGGGTITLYSADSSTPVSPDNWVAEYSTTAALVPSAGLTIGAGYWKIVLAGSTSPSCHVGLNPCIGKANDQANVIGV